MRVAVIFLAMVVAAGLIPGAQCVLKCAEPASAPPCHQAPGKQSPEPRGTCDSLMMTGESTALRTAHQEVDSGHWVVLPDAAAHLIPAAVPLKLASFRQLPGPPGDARPLVLRI